MSNIPFAAAVAVVWIGLFVLVTPAFAYIDPGSGSMMTQLLLGGVAGVAVLVRLHWQRFVEFIGLRKIDSDKP